jgi:hypothetical protein
MKKLRALILFSLLIAIGMVTWRVTSVQQLVPQVSAQASISDDESVCTSQGKEIDILQYLRPSALSSGGSGQRYTVGGCYVDSETGETKSDYTDDVQVLSKPITGEPDPKLPAALAATGFISEKGDAAADIDDEWWFFDNDNVYLYQDKSWDNKCGDGSPAFYREQNELPGEPTWGGPYKRCLNNNESTSATHVYFSYNFESGQACDADWGGDVGVAPGMTQGVTFKVVKVVDENGNYLAEEGIAPNVPDTIMIELTGGPGAGEKRFYSKGYGLSGYYAEVASGTTFHVRVGADGTELCDGEITPTLGKKREENNKVLWPIEELPEALADKDYIKAGQVMAKEGFAAKCVAQFSAKTEWGGAYERWIELNEGKTLLVKDVQSQENFDASGGKLPFVRSDIESPALNSSVENYMSVLNGKNQGFDEYEEKLAQAPAISLLTMEQQYHLKQFNLLDRKAVCDYYPFAPCALWEPEPGAIHDLEDTYTYMMQYGITGRQLAKPYDPALGISETEFYGLRERFDEVPTDMQRADDLACMVLVKELPKDHKEGLLAWFADLFNTNTLINYISPLSPEEIKADPYDNQNDEYKRDSVAAVCFPVPSFNINTSFEHYQLEHPTNTAKRALTPDWMNQQDQGMEEARRDIYLKRVQAVQQIPYAGTDKRNINPIGKPFHAPGGDYDPMTRALVDLADDAAGGCQGLVAEGAVDMKYSTKYSESDAYTTKIGFNMYSDLFLTEFTNNLSALATAVNMKTNEYLGEGADEIRDYDQAYIKAIYVGRYPQDPNEDWGEKIKNAYLTEKQLVQLSEDLADYHIAAAAVGDDPAAIDAVTESHKILGDVIPYKKDLTLENFYNWGAQKMVEEFYDPAKCTDETGATIPGASCINTLNVSVVADTPGVGVGDFGRTLNDITRITALVSALHGSPQEEHAKSSKNPEEFLTGSPTRKGQESSKSTGSTSSRPKPVAACDGGSRITSGENAVHYCVDSGRACTPTAGQCTYMDASNNIGNWKSSSDPTKDCADLIPYAACTYKGSLLGNMVNAQGQFDTNGTQTACQYVVDTAKSRGISPRLALAIWGEESGFGAVGGAMFGYNPPNSAKHFDLAYQLDGMLDLAGEASSYENFMLKYSSLDDLTNGTFCTNPHFPGRVKDYYNYLGPGR